MKTQKHWENEHHVKTEMGIMYLEVKECLGLLTITTGWEKGMVRLSLGAPRRDQGCQPSEFGLLASRARREYIFVVLSHPVFSALLRQP